MLYLVLSLLCSLLFYRIYYTFGWKSGFNLVGIVFSAFRHLVMWVSILAILGYGKKYLKDSNKMTAYFTKAAFPIYIFHQTWIVAIAYYMLKATDVMGIQFFSILLLSFVVSILTYEIFKTIPLLRWAVGIKK